MRRMRGWIIASAVALVAVSCAGSTQDEPALTVHLSEWEVGLSSRDVGSGSMDLDVSNDGLLLHELVLVEADDADATLPTVNGSLDMAALDGRVVVEVAELSPGDEIRATIDLDPGQYILFCNFAGHYDAGMYQVLEVSG